MKKPDKRTKIMQAAMELIAERGFHESPVALIAKMAGVSPGTIYGYFESKEVLLRELHCELEETIGGFILRDYSPDRPVREQFVQIGTELLHYFITHPLQFRYVAQYYDSPYGVSLRRERLFGKSEEGGSPDVIKNFLEMGIARQEIKDLPFVVICAMFFGPLYILARDHILGFVILDDALIQQTVVACWEGVRR